MLGCTLDASGIGSPDAGFSPPPPRDAGQDAYWSQFEGGPGDGDGDGDGDGPQGCGASNDGAVQERTRYAQGSVMSPATCSSEVQRRTCHDGSWSSWSGSFANTTCSVVYRDCGSLAHGSQEVRLRYAKKLVDDFTECAPEEQTRACDDGTLLEWSGSAKEISCAVELLGICEEGGVVSCAEGVCSSAKLLALVAQCLLPDGADCSNNNECINTCIDEECTEYADPGASCDANNDCNRFACIGGDNGPVCDENICACPEGTFCNDNLDCQGSCVGSRCQPKGETCDTGDHADCEAPATCMGRRCVYPDGSECDDNSDCTHTCRLELCAPLGALGESCDDAADCRAMLSCAPAVDGTTLCLRPDDGPCTASTDCVSHYCGCANMDCTMMRCQTPPPVPEN